MQPVRLQVADFYRRHYGPSSLTISIVGYVKPSQASSLALTDDFQPHIEICHT